MSTILDALRRAEQERQRGAVPSVHGPASVLAPALSGQSGARESAWRWAVAVALMLAAALAALAWWWGPERAPAPPAAVAKGAVVTSPVSPAASPTPEPPAAPAPVRQTPTPKAQPPRAPTVTAEPATRARPKPPAAPAKPPEAPAKVAGAGPVFAPRDLPASVRAELPSLRIAGITWSSNARLRMAIVNEQVLHEGEAAAPGLVLQAIEPARTLWTFRGYRVALPSQQGGGG